MTETDATKRPIQMPEKFLPYLDRHRIYKLFKDMMQDLIINLPKDHLSHMKIFLFNRMLRRDVNNILILVAPEIKFDMDLLLKNFMKYLGYAVITRRFVMDQYEKHDEHVPGCLSPELLAKVTKEIIIKQPVPVTGWLMFDHPCTLREARCLQQDGVLPTVTLILTPKQQPVPPEQFYNPTVKNMFQQDFEGLNFAYNATAKHIVIRVQEDELRIYRKCVNGIMSCIGGAQAGRQGIHVVGAPSVYRVLLIGSRGSGRETQSKLTAKHFGLVCFKFEDLFEQALKMNDAFSEQIRRGASSQMRFEIVKRRLLRRDCLDHGWIMTGFPNSVAEYDLLFDSECSPNRVLFLNTSWDECRSRLTSRAYDPSTGQPGPSNDQNMKTSPYDAADLVEHDLELFFLERHAELRARAANTAYDVNGDDSIEQVQAKIQAAIISSPHMETKPFT